ncbi:MAG: monovalent cation/H(+) antiporter subunit G [Stellaceae bacterium]
MSEASEIPDLLALAIAALLIGGAAMTLIGSLGLLRLRSFYERVHAPTLGTTLGTACIATASMIYFSALGNRPVLHEVLIVLFVIVTTPVSLMVLVHAALLRGRFENSGGAAQTGNRSSRDA